MQIDWFLRNVFFILMVLSGGCGSSVPDGAVSGSSPSPASAGQVDRTGNPTASSINRVTTAPNRSENGEARTTIAKQTEDRSLPSELSIPQSIANDLSSSDAGSRYQALDYWQAKDSTAPLDLVFEALEDEDESVREKAEAIVERRWKEEDSDES